MLYVCALCFRVLGFHRVPPAAGRHINITHDVKRLADKKLLKTVFVSPGMPTMSCNFAILAQPFVCMHVNAVNEGNELVDMAANIRHTSHA